KRLRPFSREAAVQNWMSLLGHSQHFPSWVSSPMPMKMAENLKYSTVAVTLPYRLISSHPKRSSYDSKHNGTRMIKPYPHRHGGAT
ncbi:MAG: hypothetical protein KIT39_16445, partial [Nitrospirales bacterium]|nr:hypothetical protein [Nitrospirales bacterium]